MTIFSTVVLGCLVTLAGLQAEHSLHQVTTSVAKPGQTKWAATSRCVAHRLAWETLCTCWKMACLCVAGTRGLMAPVEVSHLKQYFFNYFLDQKLFWPFLGIFKKYLTTFNFKFYFWRLFFDVLGRILQIYRKKYSFLRSLRFFENENFAARALSDVCANFFFFNGLRTSKSHS